LNKKKDGRFYKSWKQKKFGRIEEEKNHINNEIERKQTEIQELKTELNWKDEEKKNIQEGETIQLIEIGKEIEKEKNDYLLALMEDIEIKKTLKNLKKN
jgi:hypothetical protein